MIECEMKNFVGIYEFVQIWHDCSNFYEFRRFEGEWVCERTSKKLPTFKVRVGRVQHGQAPADGAKVSSMSGSCSICQLAQDPAIEVISTGGWARTPSLFPGLVLGWIHADFRVQMLMLQHFPSSTRESGSRMLCKSFRF